MLLSLLLSLLSLGIVVHAAEVAKVNVVISSQLSPDQKKFAGKTAAIIKRQIMTRCNASVTINGGLLDSASSAQVILQINASLGEEGFSVGGTSDGATTIITGGDARGLLFGSGKWQVEFPHPSKCLHFLMHA